MTSNAFISRDERLVRALAALWNTVHRDGPKAKVRAYTTGFAVQIENIPPDADKFLGEMAELMIDKATEFAMADD